MEGRGVTLGAPYGWLAGSRAVGSNLACNCMFRFVCFFGVSKKFVKFTFCKSLHFVFFVFSLRVGRHTTFSTPPAPLGLA